MAMNSLTNLIPVLYESLDVVSRELVGAIPCCNLDTSVSRGAVGQQLYSAVSPVAVVTDITPGQLPPQSSLQTHGSVALSIQKSRGVRFSWTGEEVKALENNGAGGAGAIANNQFAQAVRALINEMEYDVVRAAQLGASRAYGAAGTTPFATDLGDPANIRKILDDNGAPATDRALIINTTAGAKMRTLGQLTKANESGTIMTLRSGELMDIHGLSVHESAGIRSQAKGGGSAYTSNTAGYAVGATQITLITGTGTIIPGDIITFAGDSNKYVVAGGVSAPGVLTLAAPGLLQALPASAQLLTIVNTATSVSNVAFQRGAIVLATRTPALPGGRDSAIDRYTITDPRSGISLEVSMYAEYRQVQYEVSVAWGVAAIKPEHTAILLG